MYEVDDIAHLKQLLARGADFIEKLSHWRATGYLWQTLNL